MKMNYRKTSNILLILLVLVSFTFAQNESSVIKKSSKQSSAKVLNGVYAGMKLSSNDGLQTATTYTYYFRPNGTFTNKLNESNWQTRVDGNYSINGKTITLLIKPDLNPVTMELDDNGAINEGTFILYKLNVMNSVPAKRLDFKIAEVSDGKIVENPYDGGFQNGVIIFDGKGNFSTDLTRSVANVGNSVANNRANSKDNGGTYLIKDSILTLNYRNGTRRTMSFFYSDNPEVLAVINGDFYFEPPKNQYGTPTLVVDPNAGIVEKKGSEIKKVGTVILRAANLAHGGNSLNTIRSIKFVGRMKGGNGAIDYEIVNFLDVINQKIRYELKNNGKIVRVEQLELDSGWQWTNGVKTELDKDRISELKNVFSSGILALRSNKLDSIKINTLRTNKEDTKVMEVIVNGEKYLWIFDKNNYLVGEGSNQNGVQTLEISEDLRVVNGIKVPFSTMLQIGLMQLKIEFSSIEVNPSFSETDWTVPN